MTDAKTPSAKQIGQWQAQISRTRSRRLSLRLSPSGSLLVRAPYWLPLNSIEDYILSKTDWLDRQQQKNHRLYAFTDKYLTRQTSITYQPHDESEFRTEIQPGKITLFYPEGIEYSTWDLYQRIRPALKQRLAYETKELIPPVLERINRQFKFDVAPAKFRFARSRWGSCNRHGQIMLNTQLVRLPDELINYVVCHELAHTQHLNHGPKFHALLELMDPSAKKHSKLLAKHQLLY